MSEKKSLGVCLGASTVSIVEVKENGTGPQVKLLERIEHEGDVKNVFSGLFNKYKEGATNIGITGRKFRELVKLPNISEPEATELAYAFSNKDKNQYDAIVSAGGETFVVYKMDNKNLVSHISSGNKCASGTGEFFLQQIRRMDMDIEKAIDISKNSKNPHHLSGRCSVFCKSDCTHALNKGEPVEDVAAGLAKMIAKKIDELLVKLGAKKVLVVGGTAMNDVVIDYLRESFDSVDVPEQAPYFEALGAALWARDNEEESRLEHHDDYYKQQKSSFDFLPPLKANLDKVDFKEMPYGDVTEGDECIIGLDVGSTTTKAVLLRTRDKKTLKSIYLRTNGNPVRASRNCYQSLLDQLDGVDVHIIGLGVTGSGRYITGLHAQTDGIINEIIAHARASAHFDPQVDTIFEIGGQDAKYTFLANSVASDYAMNEACSAGTGSFLEESAYESLGVAMENIADIALKSTEPPNFSDQCAAFISSDIKTALQEGISRPDIIAGLVYSICINYLNRVKGARQVGNKIFMQGGVCYNKAVPVAMAALSGKEIIVPPEPGLMGSYGVALEVQNLIEVGLLDRQEFSLQELADREVTYGKNFICRGHKENCDRRCSINMIQVGDKKFPFGGACNKYYNQMHHKSVDVAAHNHVATRQDMVFKQFAKPRTDLPESAPVVGINRSFQVNTLYPMFFNFFNELGCKVILSEETKQSGIDKGMSSFCLSAQVALGLFEDLLDKKPDYIFMPQINEIHVSEQEEYRKEYQTVCMFVQGEPYYQKATFLRNGDGEKGPKMLTPILNLMTGYDAGEKEFIEVATEMGFSAAEGKRAAQIAVKKQLECFAAMKKEGRRLINEIENDPERTAVVLFGRPYNAFALETNKGVPFKFASRGIDIIPYDLLEYESEENYKNTFWEMGQRIIKAARIVERHPQLFGVYLTNFLCALDSVMVTHFRDMMGSKPSLTLEVDSHTADAGVNTRIEAFMDVVKNYLKIRDNLVVKNDAYQPAKIKLDNSGSLWFHDSDGGRVKFQDPSVHAVIPSMGETFNGSIAAVLQGLGMDAEALPVCDREALDLGRSVLTGKECLPLINCIGEFMKYIKYRKNPDEKLAFFLAGAGGSCRVGQYATLLETIIEERLKLKNIAVVTLDSDNGYAGLGIPFRLGAVKALIAGDVMADIKAAIAAMAVDKEAGIKKWYEEWNNILDVFNGKNKLSFYKQLRKTTRELSTIKLERPLSEAKYVGLVGEIFVRRDYFSLSNLMEKLAAKGFVVLSAPVTEWVRYVDFLRDKRMLQSKPNFIGKIESFISDFVLESNEKKIKKVLARSGLYEYELIDIKGYINHSSHYIPYKFTGEPGLSSGAMHYNLIDKWCGVVNAGPFGCMNSRMTEAITTPEMTVEGKERASKNAGKNGDYQHYKENVDVLPFFSVEFDGNPFSQILESRLETFVLQSNRLHDLMTQKKEKEKVL